MGTHSHDNEHDHVHTHEDESNNPDPGEIADEHDQDGWDIEKHGRMIDFAADPDTGGVETEKV